MADQRTYNSRVTTEALEKKFRDTFPSQAGAELVDDLYASGVIVPTVDFTAAAQGSALETSLQRAWDFSTSLLTVTSNGTPQTMTTTPGFYKIDLIASTNDFARASVVTIAQVDLFDGATTTPIWRWSTVGQSGTAPEAITSATFYVFVRSGDTLRVRKIAGSETVDIWYRQIADVSGNLINPLGFTFS